jgi:hypothetical protein
MGAPGCPACHQAMQQRPYARAPLGAGEEELNLCWGCQALWFDAGQEMELAGFGVMQLFRDIHEHRAKPRPVQDTLKCPRCDHRLQARQDIGKNGRFSFHACAAGEGRFMLFSQFLVEKGFVRRLTNAQITLLRTRVSVVRCSACGTPVDLQRDTACPACHTPVSILDPKAVQAALASYGEVKKAKALGEIDLLEAVLSQQVHVPPSSLVEHRVRQVEALELIGRGIYAVMTALD